MTRPYAIAGSALATAAINIVALAVISAAAPEPARLVPQMLNDSAPLFQLSPIPAGADWGRS